MRSGSSSTAGWARNVAALVALAAIGAAGPAPSQTVRPAERPGAAAVSDLLRPPGGDPYGAPIDWASVPPWRQTSFFGVRAQGQLFVFVVDCSGSMADDARLVRAKAELRRAVGALRWPQRYLVVFYNDRAWPMPGGIPATPGVETRSRFTNWLDRIDAEGETDPRGAMRLALGLKPDAVFLLSDGAFPDGTDAAIAATNPRRVPVHCIDLSGGAAGGQLRQIAAASGGQYAARP
jgi:hypothetical protein